MNECVTCGAEISASTLCSDCEFWCDGNLPDGGEDE
jgi:ribosomal protein L32